MPSVQKTFELIPNAIGSGLGRPGLGLGNDASAHGPPAKPPMTSKQAKKLYKQANKAPKLSKAERRRIELMEQDRIRKEFEKEKAQARARAARERKKAKEDAQKEAKKKKGLPLVDVRPSQDTIARFVKTGKKRDATGEEVHRRSPSLPAIAQDDGGQSDKENHHQPPSATDDGVSGVPGAQVASVWSGRSTEVMVRQKKPRIDPPAPSQNHVEVLQNLANVASCAAKATQPVTCNGDVGRRSRSPEPRSVDVPSVAPVAPEEQEARPQQPVSNPPHYSQEAIRTPAVISSGRSERGASQVPKAENHSVPTSSSAVENKEKEKLRTPCVHPVNTAQDGHPKPRPNSARLPSSSFMNNVKSSPRPGVSHGAMAPPPVPPRFKASGSSLPSTSQRPRFLSKHQQTRRVTLPRDPVVRAGPKAPAQPQRALRQEQLPTSTQYVLSHLDELFPTPSQESRELLEDRQLCSTLESSVPRPSGPRSGHLPVVQDPPEQPVPSLDISFFSTQDLFMSSQDVRELESGTAAPGAMGGGMPRRWLQPPKTLPGAMGGGMPRRCLQPPKTLPAAAAVLSRPTSSLVTAAKAREARALDVGQTSKRQGVEDGSTATDDTQIRLTASHPGKEPAYSSPTIGRLQGSPILGEVSRASSTASVQQTGFHSKDNRLPRRSQRTASGERNQVQHAPHIKTSESLSRPAHPAAHEEPKQPVVVGSPPKKRLFSSSGIGADSLCAMERSHRMFQREQRQAELRMSGRNTRQNGVAMDRKSVEGSLENSRSNLSREQESAHDEEDLLGDDFDGVLPSQILRVVEMGSIPAKSRPDEARPLAGAPWISSRPTIPTGSEKLLGASQETDYGDFELGSDDLDLLGVAA